MNTQCETADSIEAAEYRRQNGIEHRHFSVRHKSAFRAANLNDSAKQFGPIYGEVVVEQCISSCDPRKATRFPSRFDQPVNKKEVVAHYQDEVSGNDLVVRSALNRQKIAGP
ncbi:MAG TPA: hypothetical protein VMF10_14560 [Candidatus Aquilonibacter sp.]|nr:hypothetical protein [Candidatus Aquilonibacter sp.]